MITHASSSNAFAPVIKAAIFGGLFLLLLIAVSFAIGAGLKAIRNARRKESQSAKRRSASNAKDASN